jgi:sugar lactone lactonase YvrE
MKNNIYTSVFILFVVFAFNAAQGQTINTVAGDGTVGYAGDGGLALFARFNNPWKIALDDTGNLFVVDNGNNRIRKIGSSSNIITTIAGSGTTGYSGDGFPATAALINSVGIAASHDGNIYVTNGNAIRKIDASGIITTIAGSSISGYSGDGGPATAAKFNGINGMAFDNSNNLYVCDADNFVVRKINTTGIVSTIAGNGTSGNSGDGGAATAAQLKSPTGVVVDAAGNIYVADNAGHAIRKVNASGIISKVAGTGATGYTGDGGAATAATLHFPADVTIDASGNLYIADLYNNVIRKVNTSGVITTYAGNGTSGFSGDGGNATACAMSQPWGLTIDASGNLFVADYQNARIRKITASITGIESLVPSSIKVELSPNPNRGAFSISALLGNNTEEDIEIDVINVFGKVVLHKEVLPVHNLLQTQIALPSYITSGLYLLRMKSKSISHQQRFIIE